MSLVKYKQYGGVLLFLTLMSLGVYFEGQQRVVFLVSALTLMTFFKEPDVALCFLAQTFMCDDLKLAPSLSFSSIAALILIIKTFIFCRKHNFSQKYIVTIYCIILLQVATILIYNNEIINIIRLGINLLVLLYFINYSSIFKNYDKVTVPAIVSLTVMLACLLGINRSYYVDDLGVLRFSGIWIDDNFCGMYCVLGILSSIYSVFLTRKSLIFAIPSILLALYMGSLSMSRTFIYVMIILAFFLILSVLKNKSFGIFYKIILVAFCFVGIVYFMNNIAANIIEARGAINVGGGGDFTNGRIESSLQSLKVWEHTPLAWIIGIGSTNTYHIKAMFDLYPQASHNTYVDILVEFGIIIFIYILFIIFKFFRKFLLENSSSIPYTVFFSIVVLCYMGTLTMGQYSILYIAIGMMFNYLNTPIKNAFGNLKK